MNKKLSKFEFNSEELEYLRDLFSVMLEDGSTISERLAILISKEKLELSLWQKIYKECENLKLSVDKKAPNFLITPENISLGIFKAKFLDENEEMNDKGKENEKSKSRSKNISSSQDKDKDNSQSSSRRSNKKKS
jgi:hypothetical protein